MQLCERSYDGSDSCYMIYMNKTDMYGCPTLCEDNSYNQCNDNEILCPAELDENGCTTEQVCIDPFVPGTVPCRLD